MPRGSAACAITGLAAYGQRSLPSMPQQATRCLRPRVTGACSHGLVIEPWTFSVLERFVDQLVGTGLLLLGIFAINDVRAQHSA